MVTKQLSYYDFYKFWKTLNSLLNCKRPLGQIEKIGILDLRP